MENKPSSSPTPSPSSVPGRTQDPEGICKELKEILESIDTPKNNDILGTTTTGDEENELTEIALDDESDAAGQQKELPVALAYRDHTEDENTNAEGNIGNKGVVINRRGLTGKTEMSEADQWSPRKSLNSKESESSQPQLGSNDAVCDSTAKDTFTVSQAIDALGFGKFQAILSLFTGLCWMADSMEMMILSILAPALHCEWCISEVQQASLTLAVFAGMMISSPFWGYLSDRSGRRLALWFSVGVLFIFGLASSFSWSYAWLIAFRFCVGFAIGCVPQSVTLYAEFLPTKQRAKCVILLDCFWALGACLEVFLALLVMPTLGWQWLLALSALPVFIFCIMCYWLPESVRYLATSGETEKAMTTLKRIADDNGRPMLLGRLIVDDMHTVDRGRFKDLLMPEMRKTTLLLWFIWMACAFCYYGVVLMSTQILKQFEIDANNFKLNGNFDGPNITGDGVSHLNGPFNMTPIAAAYVAYGTDPSCGTSSCTRLTTSDYVYLLWITLAEFPGILITIFVLDRIGRKKTICCQFILFAITIMALCFPIHNLVLMIVILFFARGIVSGVFQAAYVYTPEVYPTSMRAIGIGTCSSMARIGAMATPYIAQVLLESSRPLAVTCYGIIALIAALLSMILPIETKGKAMPDSVTRS